MFHRLGSGSAGSLFELQNRSFDTNVNENTKNKNLFLFWKVLCFYDVGSELEPGSVGPKPPALNRTYSRTTSGRHVALKCSKICGILQRCAPVCRVEVQRVGA